MGKITDFKKILQGRNYQLLGKPVICSPPSMAEAYTCFSIFDDDFGQIRNKMKEAGVRHSCLKIFAGGISCFALSKSIKIDKLDFIKKSSHSKAHKAIIGGIHAAQTHICRACLFGRLLKPKPKTQDLGGWWNAVATGSLTNTTFVSDVIDFNNVNLAHVWRPIQFVWNNRPEQVNIAAGIYQMEEEYEANNNQV